MTLTGKRALVTGASRGIRASIAKALVAEGADVAITYEKSADRAAEVVAAIKATGRKAVAIQADSADGAAVQASVEKTVAALGGLDILVNNAGILRVAELKDISLAEIDALLDVNVRAQIIASKAALTHLGKGGRIITIGSYFADRVPASVLSVYAATKSALTAFTKGLARELGPKEVTVNIVQPGSIDTDMNPAGGPYADTLRQFMALGHYGVAEDIANAVAFLASPKAQYITGSILTVDGGANARSPTWGLSPRSAPDVLLKPLIIRSTSGSRKTRQSNRSARKSGETAMKHILSPLVLMASVGLSYADPIDWPVLSQTSSVTTEYPAFHAFHHSVGETSYAGYYFNSRPSNCSVIIWSNDNNEAPPDETTHQKVRIDLNAKQAITFFADDLGSNLNLECSADAKSLSVRQTSISLTQ